ncbi:hypothetical protein ACSQ67_003244 [Phaseolus vulgaris]
MGRSICTLLGTLVEVDEATLALDELEFARLRIRVTVGCEAKLTLYMKINETMYEIYLMEGYTVLWEGDIDETRKATREDTMVDMKGRATGSSFGDSLRGLESAFSRCCDRPACMTNFNASLCMPSSSAIENRDLDADEARLVTLKGLLRRLLKSRR